MRSRKLITADELTVVTKSFLYPVVMEDGEGSNVFPVPPAPIRAMGSSFTASPTTFSISSSCPKQSLGAGGGNSLPRGTL